MKNIQYFQKLLHSDRKHLKISTADLPDDEIMNENFCESVFEDDNDETSGKSFIPIKSCYPIWFLQ